jgi:hypothetical protein
VGAALGLIALCRSGKSGHRPRTAGGDEGTSMYIGIGTLLIIIILLLILL